MGSSAGSSVDRREELVAGSRLGRMGQPTPIRRWRCREGGLGAWDGAAVWELSAQDNDLGTWGADLRVVAWELGRGGLRAWGGQTGRVGSIGYGWGRGSNGRVFLIRGIW